MARLDCPSCGAEGTERVGQGLCPSCLLGLALLGPDETAGPPAQDATLSSSSMLAVLDGGTDRTLYLAEQPGTRRFLAIEVVRGVGAVPETAAAAAARTEALRGLTHPGIARVLGGWATPEGDYCVAWEYHPGSSLERYCAARQLAAPERIARFLVACQAIGYAHAAGVVHGGLSPTSILMTRQRGEMQPVITGFGLGTGRTAGPASDVAALGDMLERLMADETGPSGEAARRAARAARNGEIASVAGLIAALEGA